MTLLSERERIKTMKKAQILQTEKSKESEEYTADTVVVGAAGDGASENR